MSKSRNIALTIFPRIMLHHTSLQHSFVTDNIDHILQKLNEYWKKSQRAPQVKMNFYLLQYTSTQFPPLSLLKGRN